MTHILHFMKTFSSKLSIAKRDSYWDICVNLFLLLTVIFCWLHAFINIITFVCGRVQHIYSVYSYGSSSWIMLCRQTLLLSLLKKEIEHIVTQTDAWFWINNFCQSLQKSRSVHICKSTSAVNYAAYISNVQNKCQHQNLICSMNNIHLFEIEFNHSCWFVNQ